MTARAIVLGANILVRAVLGSRVPELLANAPIESACFACFECFAHN